MNGENQGGQVFDADVALKAVRSDSDQLDLISRSGRPTSSADEVRRDTDLMPGTEDTLLPEPLAGHATEGPTEAAEAADAYEGSDDDPTETVNDPRIPPNQQFFKIGEVAEIVGVKPYVLRYWENEFSWVKPEKTSSRQRRYRRQDVAVLLQIRRLRYDEQLTVARTRELIRDSRRKGTGGGLPTSYSVQPPPITQTPLGVKNELREMRTILEGLLEAAQRD